MARVWRDGQRRKVHIYRLLTTVSQWVVSGLRCYLKVLVGCELLYKSTVCTGHY